MVHAQIRRVVKTGSLLVASMAIVGCGSLLPLSPSPPPPPAAPSPPLVAAAPSSKPVPPAAPREPVDATPRVERIAPGFPNRPYEIRGEKFEPENTDVPMHEVGVASWYGVPFHGRLTSNGERYDMNAMTAAHPTMPLPSYVRVRHLSNGREVVVRVNDRGPFRDGRIIDLSRAAARKLRITGIARVEVVRLTHEDIRSGAWKQPASKLAMRKALPVPDVKVAQSAGMAVPAQTLAAK